MSARPVLLTADEQRELERMLFECPEGGGDPAIAQQQYLAELIVLRGLLNAAKARSHKRIERALLRLARPSFVAERSFAQEANEPPPLGSERLL